MTAAFTSDHLNYLVWRYLQECGYANAAVQLQRDWSNGDPQQLPFAHAVKPLTLRSIVQDGLTYDQLLCDAQRRHSAQPTPVQSSPTTATVPGAESAASNNAGEAVTAAAETSNDEASAAAQPPGPPQSRYTFITAKRRPVSERPTEEGSRPSSSSQDGSRKKPRVAPSARRRPIKDLGQDSREDTMEIDAQTPRQEDQMRDASPMREPPPPPPTTLEVGSSTGVQSDPQIDKTICKLVADITIPDSDLVHLHWHTSDPQNLETCGEALWRTYNLPDQVLTKEDGSPSDPPFDSFASTCAKKFYITARCHAPHDSDKSAVALEEDDDLSSGVAVYAELSSGGRQLLLRPSGSTPILHFSPNAKYLLAIVAISENSWQLVLWDAEDTDELFPSQLDLSDVNIAGAAWLGESEFAICGRDMLDLYRVQTIDGAPVISFVKSMTASKDWEQLAFDFVTKKLACISPEDGFMGLLTLPESFWSGAKEDSEFDFRSQQVHEQDVTSLVWQPLPNSTTLSEGTPRILATSCNNGEVKLWDTRSGLECLHTFAMDISTPAMALAFSGSGLQLAAAGGRQVKIWNVDETRSIFNHWEAKRIEDSDDGDQDMADETDDAPFHQLAWNCTSRRIAYTQGDRLTVLETVES